MIDKRFHKGIELKNNLLYFKGINHLPHITDIIHGYNTILEENKRLMKENQELRMSPRVDVNEIESLVCENEKLKSEITTLKGGYDEYEEIIGELKAENEKLKEENKSWLKTASRMDTIHHEDREYCERIHGENEKLKQQLSDINGQLVMLDNCDNWDYDRMKHTVREIAEIIGYNGTINPKR